MLHMLINTHNPESCAYRGETEDATLTAALRALQTSTGEHGLTVEGSWVNRPSHELFLLVDAPNGHVIEQALVDYGLVGRTHTRVVAVVEVTPVLDEERQHAAAAS